MQSVSKLLLHVCADSAETKGRDFLRVAQPRSQYKYGASCDTAQMLHGTPCQDAALYSVRLLYLRGEEVKIKAE